MRLLVTLASVAIMLLGGTSMRPSGRVVAAPSAQTVFATPEAALQQLFTALHVQADWFTPDLLREAPLPVIETGLAGARAGLGNFRTVTKSFDIYLVSFDSGILPVRIGLDSAGRVDMFLFGNPLIAAPGTAPAAVTAFDSPEAALRQIFTADHLKMEWFHPEVLQQVSIAQFEMVIATLKSVLGGFLDVTQTPDGYIVGFEGGRVPAQFALDRRGQVVEFLLGEPRFFDPAAGLIRVVAALQSLPGRVSVLVLRDGQERASARPDDRLAVGSAFKLAVLLALQEQINQGLHSWDEIVALRPEWKTLPSGALRNWPDTAPLTLDTLATLMISASDNTATDALMDIAGRQAIEALAAANRPLLTPREFFILKDPANQDLLARWRSGDEAARRIVLQDADHRGNPPQSLFSVGPVATDVEWFFNTRELCALMGKVADLPLMGVNRGLVTGDNWAQVAYKGGSEPGVLNLTYWLVDQDGHASCVAATWNNDASVSETQFGGLLRLIIAALGQQTP